MVLCVARSKGEPSRRFQKACKVLDLSSSVHLHKCGCLTLEEHYEFIKYSHIQSKSCSTYTYSISSGRKLQYKDMFASHPMSFGNMSLSAFYPGTTHSSMWDDDNCDIFDLMYSHMGGAMSRGAQGGSCRGLACSRSRAQRQEALRLRAEKARREEQRRVQQQKRFDEERRRALEQRRKKSACKHAKVLVLEDDPQDHLTIGVILNRAVSPDNISIEIGEENTLKISQYKSVPIYQYGRDMWGMPVAQHQGYRRKQKVWSETLAIDDSVNVSDYCAQIKDNVLVITMPYHLAGVYQADAVLRVPIEGDDMQSVPTTSDDMHRIPIDDEQDAISEEETKDQNTSHGMEEPRIKDNQTIRSIHDDDEEEEEEGIAQETQSPKSIQDVWKDMDGSIEDCEY